MQTTNNAPPPPPAPPTPPTIVTVGPDGTAQTIEVPAPPGHPVAVVDPALAPIAITEAPPWWVHEPVVRLGLIGIFLVLLPLSIAIAIRLIQRPYRRPDSVITPAVEDRLARLEQSIDAIAIEMERVSEGQRYVTKLLATEKVAP